METNTMFLTAQTWMWANRWKITAGERPSFCALQLHGSICFPVQPGVEVDYATLFEAEPKERAEKLFQSQATTVATPILFPWEIITRGKFVEDASFPFGNNSPIRPLFRGVWERARSEILSAKRISFVGLSMHSFLLDGLKYLFEGKQDKVEIVLANPDNTPFVRGKSETHWNKLPHSPGYALSQMLTAAAPKMSRFGIVPGFPNGDGDITLVHDFASFIKTQMRPVEL
jgi:hypothetical protein